MWRDDAHLLDILIHARRVREFTTGVTPERFEADPMLHSAVAYNLQIVGEAARKVSQEFRDSRPEIPWKGMIDLRTLLVHEYFRINLRRIWEIAEKEIPPLIEKIEPLVPPEDRA